MKEIFSLTNSFLHLSFFVLCLQFTLSWKLMSIPPAIRQWTISVLSFSTASDSIFEPALIGRKTTLQLLNNYVKYAKEKSVKYLVLYMRSHTLLTHSWFLEKKNRFCGTHHNWTEILFLCHLKYVNFRHYSVTLI